MVLKGVEIMKQLVKVNGKCCCVEIFYHSLMYVLAVLINIDEVKGAEVEEARGEEL